MSRIAFLLDFEEGHFLPTFKLAKALRSRGHRIHYLGPASTGSLVCQQGFDFVQVLDDVFRGMTRSADAGPLRRAAGTVLPHFDFSALIIALLRNRALDGVIERLQPDGLIMPTLYSFEALLIRYRYQLPVVLFNCHFRPAKRAVVVEQNVGERFASLKSDAMLEVLAALATAGFRFKSFWEMAQVVLRMPELVLMPQGFDLPELTGDPDVKYVGGGVDLDRVEQPFPWDALDSRLPIVYCSLGSQSDVEADTSRRFFQCVVDTAAVRPDLQWLLSIGKGSSAADFPVPSPNLYLSNWVPQMTVLGRAALMVNHAGIGTVKECILQGVPMVVLPLMRDQFDCAKRVSHLRLGVQGALAEMTPSRLSLLIDEVAADPVFRMRVAAMQEQFRAENDSSRGVDAVESAIANGAA